jgi:transcriptional regulator with XRE-family HTH domain
MSLSQESLAVSLRIPNELLTKIDQLAEERFKSIKGKPNRSLAILRIIDEYFNTASDSVDSQIVTTVSDSVSRLEFDELRQLVNTLSDTVRQIELITKLSELPVSKLAERLKVSPSTLSHWRSSGSKGKTLDEILKATREKDPEKIGWLPIEGGKWKPEREMGSNPSTIQVELLENSTTPSLDRVELFP